MADRKQSREDKLLRQAFLELALEEADTHKASLAKDPALLNQAEESYRRHAPRALDHPAQHAKKEAIKPYPLAVCGGSPVDHAVGRLATDTIAGGGCGCPAGAGSILSPSQQVEISPRPGRLHPSSRTCRRTARRPRLPPHQRQARHRRPHQPSRPRLRRLSRPGAATTSRRARRICLKQRN